MKFARLVLIVLSAIAAIPFLPAVMTTTPIKASDLSRSSDIDTTTNASTLQRATVDDSAYGVRHNTRYDGWARGTHPIASGHGFHKAATVGQTMTYRTAASTGSITFVTYRGPDQGQAQIYIDGVSKGILDLYAPVPEWRYLAAYGGLSLKQHTITVKVLGKKNTASRGFEVRVDAFWVNRVYIQDDNPATRYGFWSAAVDTRALGRSYRATAVKDASIRFTSSGTRFTWITARGPSYGQARVIVDGVPRALVDLYAPSTQWQYHYVLDGLGPGTHAVQIVVAGTRNAASRGNGIVVDGFIIEPGTKTSTMPPPSPSDQQPLTLVANGRARATIQWWSAESSPVLPFAAAEIRSYVNRMSGVLLPVQQGAKPANLQYASSAVVITANGATTSPVPSMEAVDAQLASAPDDAFVVRTDGQRIVLAGVNARATLYAAYALLEQLGIRFFAPNFVVYEGHHEYVPAKATVQVAPLTLYEAPGMKYRRRQVTGTHTVNTLQQLLDWMAKNRLNTLVVPADASGLGRTTWDGWREPLLPELAKRAIKVEAGLHGYQTFLPESTYKAQHPDWFADPSEPVDGISRRPPANVFRISNPEALQTYIDNVIAYLRQRPEIVIFDAWPPDSARWPIAEIAKFGGIGNAQAYVTNKLNASVKAVLPHVTIETIAYVPATDPPDAPYMYDPKILIDFAPFNRSYTEPIFASNVPINVYFDELLLSWRNSGFRGEASLFEYYRKGSWHSLPIVVVDLISQEVPRYWAEGMNGLGIYAEPADWITYELTHILTAQLAWNPQLDTSHYIQTYLTARFGTAGDDIRSYVRFVEQGGRSLFDRPEGNYGSVVAVKSARAAFIEAKTHLDAAKTKATAASVSSDPGAVAFLVERLGWNLDFAIADTEISYFTLLGDTTQTEDAKSRARNLVESHRFDGIVLHALPTMSRYNPDATAEDSWKAIDEYHSRW